MQNRNALEAINTGRLLLRRVRVSDWPAVRELWEDQKRSGYAVYDNPKDTDPEAVRTRIARWASCAESREHMFFAVCLRETFIGFITLNARDGSYELAYCFHSAYQGKGHAWESVSALLRAVQAATGIGRFFAGTAVNNIPSVRLLTALGFRRTGTEQVSFYKDAEGRDIFFEGGIYELTPVEQAVPSAE